MPTFRTKLWMILAGAFISVFQFDAIPAAHSKDNNSRPYEINVVAVTQPPTLDGVLSGNKWKNAALIQNFTQKEPKEGVSASEATAVLILYDANYIYFGVRCFDKKPDRIVASEMRRDYNLSENDYFEIIIDTFRDHRNAFYFATNSVGARWDCEVKREGQLINWNWDGVWKSAATKDRLGWTAEIAIPFQTLRYNNSRELIWGINFGRYIPRKREEAYWSPISRNDDFDDFGKYKPSKFGILRGLQNIKQKRRFQFKPYSIGGIQNRFDISGTERLTDVGLDAKFHITPNITSDLTVNTDFAQVEADAEQVNISRFNLFFPEKRDFFLEDLDVFNIGEGSASDPFTLLFLVAGSASMILPASGRRRSLAA